ncbi:flagellar hook-associated family protein [Aureimonas phyllosphaerae]|uniref:Flagellin n=1 Tax=Aureimonas phyllosphaerae TaxID=1166078 RepID=A0A7W6BPA4_9HYPH|nr:flagellar hook-associated family protein [Aureimonas phyllosphaerae]MBB3935558.1 flagellar hook-associated protein 3 FlgL [Aureimonas phyllosphaerae]MBB3959566.1 flagellar hook-associated protein 3 FlgL [Aureimonas phyllosphaerae]SFF12248.1 flagellar hook-associated protein 3 FlgL [Aureimonas phyllosphaerae]
MTISSLSFNAATRATILRLQSELKDATTELSSGRHADIGMTLGRLTGDAVQYHSQETSIVKMLESNNLVTSRLELMDDTLDDLRSSAESVSSNLMTVVANGANADAVAGSMIAAKGALGSLIGSLNVNITGQYLFAGAQTDQLPMTDASNVVATQFQAFLAAAGKTPETVTKDELTRYFSKDGFTATGGQIYRFDDMFADNLPPTAPPQPSWNDWSTASDTPVVSRISKTETIESSLSTSDSAIRKITAAYALIGSVGLDKMGADARTAVASAAYERVGDGMKGLTALQTQIGGRLNRVEIANTALNTQKALVQNAIDRLEGVDTAEAGLRVSALETQLQASFTVTGRLKNLSLLNYL